MANQEQGIDRLVALLFPRDDDTDPERRALRPEADTYAGTEDESRAGVMQDFQALVENIQDIHDPMYDTFVPNHIPLYMLPRGDVYQSTTNRLRLDAQDAFIAIYGVDNLLDIDRATWIARFRRFGVRRDLFMDIQWDGLRDMADPEANRHATVEEADRLAIANNPALAPNGLQGRQASSDPETTHTHALANVAQQPRPNGALPNGHTRLTPVRPAPGPPNQVNRADANQLFVRFMLGGPSIDDGRHLEAQRVREEQRREQQARREAQAYDFPRPVNTDALELRQQDEDQHHAQNDAPTASTERNTVLESIERDLDRALEERRRTDTRRAAGEHSLGMTTEPRRVSDIGNSPTNSRYRTNPTLPPIAEENLRQVSPSDRPARQPSTPVIASNDSLPPLPTLPRLPPSLIHNEPPLTEDSEMLLSTPRSRRQAAREAGTPRRSRPISNNTSQEAPPVTADDVRGRPTTPQPADGPPYVPPGTPHVPPQAVLDAAMVRVRAILQARAAGASDTIRESIEADDTEEDIDNDDTEEDDESEGGAALEDEV